MPQPYNNDLLTYFTDVEDLRDLFKAYLAAPELPKRILVIHGVGGIGKSSLLRMFRLHCKGVGTPVALASGDEAKSVLAILGDWADDLKADGVNIPTFAKTRQHYRTLQARAEEKAQESRKKLGDLAGKTAGKVAETAAGAVVGAAIGSVIPGIGTIAGALGGMGAEALVDWLRGQGFAKPDIDLLLDPAKTLTDDFLADIERVAPKRRLVLMLDTFEQLSALEDWARDLAQRLHPNVLLVLAGRAMPSWGRAWSGWLAQVHVEELKPMTDDVMRALIRRYYATMRGGEPDPKQVEAIINFARGLPMVVTTAVQLWIEYGVEDFEAVKAEVVADLVDRLKEGVPEEMTSVLEAAATVRWFNKDILCAVTGQVDVNKAYDELRRFPFVRSRVEGLALHDAMREIMDEYLRVHNPERHRELHERAARYFETRLTERPGAETERLGLERMYHRVSVDEQTGIGLFQEMAERLTRYRLISPLRVLMNDVDTYLLKRENSQLWREYYRVRLRWLGSWQDDDDQIYQSISTHPKAESKLRAYALCDLGQILVSYSRLDQDPDAAKALSVIEKSLGYGPVDSHLNQNYFSLARIALYQGEWTKYTTYLEKAKQSIEQQADFYELAYVYSEMMEAGGPHGVFKDYFLARDKGLAALAQTGSDPLPLRARLNRKWLRVWAFAGRYASGEQVARESLEIERQTANDTSPAYTLRDLGWILGFQNRFDEAERCFDQSLALCSRLGKAQQINEARVTGLRGVILARRGRYDQAAICIRRSFEGHQVESYFPGSLLEVRNWLGFISELQGKWEEADQYYRDYVTWSRYGSYYFECSAITGLGRVKYAQGNFATIPELLAEAEQLAQEYEYNDHLASLRLTQGHIAWDGHIPEWGTGFEAAFRHYQHALIYALRYNRFLLDEALSGRPQGTPLRPITPHCLERGEEGRRMLVALRDWWQTGVNDVGTPRPDTISPIPEAIPLLEAERIAREREPGDGSPQRMVLEQIKAALTR